MNQLQATIKKIETIDNMTHITLFFGKQIIEVIDLELDPNVKIDSIVNLTIKSTDIAIAKNFSGYLSYRNQLKANIININNGKIFSNIELNMDGFILETLIMLKTSLEMKLKVGEEVTLLIKWSDISIYI